MRATATWTLAATVLAGTACLDPPSVAPDAGATCWGGGTEMPTAVAQAGVARVGSAVYLLGGVDASGAERAAVLRYDEESRSWAEDESMRLPMPMYAPNVAVVGDTIYLLGALTGDEVAQVAPSFKRAPEDIDWVSVTETGGPRPRGASAVVVDGDRVHLLGGSRQMKEDGGLLLREYDLLTPAGDTIDWEEMPTLPEATTEASATLHDGQLYLFQGITFDLLELRSTNAVYRFDGSTWSSAPSLPRSRAFASVAQVDDRAFLLGGLHSLEPMELALAVNVLDLKEETWTEAALPLCTPAIHASTFVSAGSIHVVGGTDDWDTEGATQTAHQVMEASDL